MNLNFYSFTKSLSIFFCGLWIGVLMLLGYAVAPEIFRFMESKTLAGQLNGIILLKMNMLEWVIGVLLFLSTAFLFFAQRNRKNFIQWIFSILMLGSLFYYSRVITPRMEQLKYVIQNFDIPRNEDPRPERDAFDRDHRLYSGLVKTNLMIGIALTLLMAYNRKNE